MILFLVLLHSLSLYAHKLTPSEIQLPVTISRIVDLSCLGQLDYAYVLAYRMEDLSSELLHLRSALSYLIKADVTNAITNHKTGKVLNSTLMPPLAKLHVVDNKLCGGLSDIFYSSAIIIKRLVDTNASTDEVLSGHRTMITLCSDSGLISAARLHLQASIALNPLDLSLYIRNVLLVPGVYRNLWDVISSRQLQWDAVYALQQAYQSANKSFRAVITNVDEFLLTPNFYFIYQGFNDMQLLQVLHTYYLLTISNYGTILTNSIPIHPRHYLTTSAPANEILQNRRMRIGFVSSHFKNTHSICKLFCGIINKMANMDKRKIIYLFSATQQGTEKSIIEGVQHNNVKLVKVGNFLLSNRKEVTERNIDILIYLDYGLDPSTRMWAGSRLAGIQCATWGHPSTTGLFDMIDYFIMSQLYYPYLYQHDNPSNLSMELHSVKELLTDNISSNTFINHYTQWYNNWNLTDNLMGQTNPDVLSGWDHQQRFSEQLIMLDTLGFEFNRSVIPELLSLMLNTFDYGQSESSISMSKLQRLFQMNKLHYTREELNYYAQYNTWLINRPNEYYSAILTGVQSKPLLASIVKDKMNNPHNKYVLCPQHLSKIHPILDDIIFRIFTTDPTVKLIMLFDERKTQWKLTLEARWAVSLQNILDWNNRIVWLTSLTPHEYVLLLSIGIINSTVIVI